MLATMTIITTRKTDHMAEIANDFTFAPIGRPEKYPWREWADGQTRVLTRGIDFTSAVESIQNTVHVWARRNGFIARTQRIEADRVAIQMTAKQ